MSALTNGNNKRILLIDDSEVISKILGKFFKDNQFRFDFAINGRLGLQKSLELHPELILCDIEMPYMNGIQYLEEKNKIQNIKDIPVVMLTARSGDKDVRRAVFLGAVAYIAKPFSLEDLLKTVCKVLKLDYAGESSTYSNINLYYDSGIIFSEISGKITPQTISSIKYKLIELKILYSIKELKLLYLINDVPDENLSLELMNDLFKIVEDEEVNINPENFVVIAEGNKFKNLFQQSRYTNRILLTDKFLTAIRKLDFKPESYKEVRSSMLAPSTKLPYDLYDEKGNLVFPAFTAITDKEISEIRESGVTNFYFLIDDNKTKNKTPTPGDISLTKDNKKVSVESVIEGKNVLIIEDSQLVRINIGRYLEQKGVIVNFAENGIEGLEKVRQKKPDIIILDLILPKMDGIEFLEEFRKYEPNLPVVILTHVTAREKILALRKYNINGFISKPFRAYELFLKLTEILSPSFKA